MALEDQHRNPLFDKEDIAQKPSHTQNQQPVEQGRALADNPKAWLNDYKAALTPGESVEPAPLQSSFIDKAVTLALDSEPARVQRSINAVENNEGVKVAAELGQDLRDTNFSKAVGPGTDKSYAYVLSSGDIDSFQNRHTGIHVHIDREGNFYNQARELVNASAALSYAEQQNVIAPANLAQSRANLPPLPADSPAASQQAVKVPEPVAKIAAEYAPAQTLSF